MKYLNAYTQIYRQRERARKREILRSTGSESIRCNVDSKTDPSSTCRLVSLLVFFGIDDAAQVLVFKNFPFAMCFFDSFFKYRIYIKQTVDPFLITQALYACGGIYGAPLSFGLFPMRKPIPCLLPDQQFARIYIYTTPLLSFSFILKKDSCCKMPIKKPISTTVLVGVAYATAVGVKRKRKDTFCALAIVRAYVFFFSLLLLPAYRD